MPTSVSRFRPCTTPSPRELELLERMQQHRKLFYVLYHGRGELFDDAFQDELADMYRDTGEGKPPVAPAILAMTLVLQAYCGVSDREAVELSVVDRRWQLVLDTTADTAPCFSKSTLSAFRQRLCEHKLDRRLLDRLVEITKRTNAFDWKKLPKTLRAGHKDELLDMPHDATLDPSIAKILRAAARALERKAAPAARFGSRA